MQGLTYVDCYIIAASKYKHFLGVYQVGPELPLLAEPILILRPALSYRNHSLTVEKLLFQLPSVA